MPEDTFRCYLVSKDAAGQAKGVWTTQPTSALAAGDVLVRVHYSSLNYKDALSATGHPGVTRRYPHVPGIDAAGIVDRSSDSAWPPGTPAVVTGFDLGQNTWGGYGESIRVPASWLVPLPVGLSLYESMIYGTAGMTAGLALDTLIARGIAPEAGEIVVTGASGGVGSLAVAILARVGYRVAAVTGKPQAHEFLKSLGAARLLSRQDVVDATSRPLLSAQWAGAVDTVGGQTLATLVRSTSRGGCVAACGLVGGADVPLTVYPFLLRGVDLAGIDSAEPPMDRRRRVWQRLATDWRPPSLGAIGHEIVPDALPREIERILRGETQGRGVLPLR